MSLSEFSIQRPVFAWMLMIGLILFGALSFTQLGVDENPDVDFPTINVSYLYEGATPEVMEKDVVEPVESVLVGIEGIKTLTSTSGRGSARITLEFELDKDIDFALQEVQTFIARAQRTLPTSVDPPVVTKSNAADDPIMYLALSTETLSTRDLMILFRDQVRDRISTAQGVAEVRAFGYHEPTLRVDLESEKLEEYQLTPSDVLNNLQRDHLELPAGRFENKEQEQLIRILGEGETVEDFKNMTLSRRGGSPNYQTRSLEEVAQIYEGLENIRRISRYNGKNALAMAIQKQRGVNAVETAENVKERMKEINKTLPEGTELTVNYDGTKFVKASVMELLLTLLLSALLTSIVCWLFLKSFSATINILLAIPTSVIGTFIFMYFFDFTLNTFSLLGLSLAIGIIVDDAIVMLENIVRYRQMGFGKIEAAQKGSKEIMFAVIVTTMALVAIFAPVTVLDGIEGRFFFEFAITLCIAVSLSSLEALTLTPMRCSQLLNIKDTGFKIHQKMDSLLSFLKSKYENFLNKALQYKGRTLVGAFTLFFLSFGFLSIIETEFAPAQDRGVIFLIFQAPDGSSLEYTEKKIKEFEKIMENHPDIGRYFTAVGGFGQGGQGNKGNGVALLKDQSQRKKSQFEIGDDLRREAKKIEGLVTFVRDRSGSSLGNRRGSPIELTIQGPSLEKQKEIFEMFREQLEKDGRSVGIRSDEVRTLPEVHFIPNREKARARGVEIAEIAQAINVALGGVIAGQYTYQGRRYDIFVQLQEKDRLEKEQAKSLYVRNNRGESIPLSELVDIKLLDGPQEIFRENRIRGVRLDANLLPGVSQGAVIKFIKDISNKILPEGYNIVFSENLDSKFFNILFIIFLGLAISYMVLASQFNSFTDPLVIFLAIPFAIIGAFMALFFGGQTINIYSLIGILLTMGIVKKNSILIIEFANQLQEQGKSLMESIQEASLTRFRPILMTSLATVAAAIPPAILTGPGSETRLPMALVVVGGVLVATFFTLFVIPCVYVVKEKYINRGKSNKQS